MGTIDNDDLPEGIPQDVASDALMTANLDWAWWNDAEDKQVRIVRVVVYEGPGGWVRAQLARELPAGVRIIDKESTITTYEGNPKLMDPDGE